jgi:hypothetical protein
MISHSISTIINTNIPNTLLVHAKFQYTLFVIQATIDENISMEIPFDIPFSVISSHNRISNIAQTVMLNAVNNKLPIDVSITFPHNK